MPERVTCALEARVELEAVRAPDCWPALVGEKATCAVQLSPGASVDVQVVDASRNWLEVESANSVSGMAPLFVKTTIFAGLALPTAVVGKARDTGCTCRDPAAPPIPVREAMAAVTNAVELTVSAPVTTPFLVGVKTTPAEQLAPGGRVGLQVF
jgi:hypothetical protein